MRVGKHITPAERWMLWGLGLGLLLMVWIATEIYFMNKLENIHLETHERVYKIWADMEAARLENELAVREFNEIGGEGD